MKNVFAALLCDVVKSSSLTAAQRNDVQDRLLYASTLVNELLSPCIESQVIIASGDSLEGLFIDPSSAARAYLLISLVLSPYKLRAGIGVGAINEGILRGHRKLNSTAVDGKAYVLADLALTDCRKLRRSIVIHSSERKDLTQASDLIESAAALSEQCTFYQLNLLNLFNLFFPWDGIDTMSFFTPTDILRFDEANKRSVKGLSGKYRLEKTMLSRLMRDLKKDDLRYTGTTNSYPPELTSMLSNLLSTSRQNLAKIKKGGNFEIIRRLQDIALNMLED